MGGKALILTRAPIQVFLSDEELEVFKMTMGKQATHELKPASLETLEPSLFNQVLF